jgi:hypothetical protein
MWSEKFREVGSPVNTPEFPRKMAQVTRVITRERSEMKSKGSVGVGAREFVVQWQQAQARKTCMANGQRVRAFTATVSVIQSTGNKGDT